MDNALGIPTPIDPSQRAIRPALVRWVQEMREDRNASIREKRNIQVPCDVALVSPLGSKDVYPFEVKAWFERLAHQVREGQIPPQLADYYRDSYRRWREGQEMPPAGTPIAGWRLLSGTDQQRVIDARILTVEDLAEAGLSNIQAIGPGAVAMQAKAKSWLDVGRDQAGVTLQLEASQQAVSELTRQVDELRAAMMAKQAPKRRGRPPKPIALEEKSIADGPDCE